MLLNFVAENLARDYVIFSYLLCLAALQVVANLSGLRGLTFVPAPWSIPAGLIGATADIAWFFSSADRNTIGLAGWEQFFLFLVGAAGAVLTSLFIASLVWRRVRRRAPPPPEGVDALRYMSYWEALASRWMR